MLALYHQKFSIAPQLLDFRLIGKERGASAWHRVPRARKMREASPTLTTTMDVLTQLKGFRQAAYDYLGKAHDATFELADAVMSSAQCLLFGRLFPVSSV